MEEKKRVQDGGKVDNSVRIKYGILTSRERNQEEVNVKVNPTNFYIVPVPIQNFTISPTMTFKAGTNSQSQPQDVTVYSPGLFELPINEGSWILIELKQVLHERDKNPQIRGT